LSGLTENIYLLTPEFVLAGLAILVLGIDLFLPEDRKDVIGWISIASLVLVGVLTLIMLPGHEESLYGGLVAVDAFSLLFKIVFLVIGVFIILSSMEYIKRNFAHQGEFYGLLLFSILGMNLMVQARELLTAYIALELLSFSLYIMVTYSLNNRKSNEAGIKYIIVGAFSSAVLLYGLSMVYGVVGVTRFNDIATAISGSADLSPSLWVGVALIFVGLGFKLSIVPFHMWAPDTYEGAPLPVTAYLAIASKTAAFALVLRFLCEGVIPAGDLWHQWQIIFAIIAALSMLTGNLVALAQTNMKRLMAYSSIGHVGYILAGIAVLSAGSTMAINSVSFYLVGYAVTNMIVFGAIISFFNMTGKDDIADFRGLADTHPLLAASIAIALFSLAGLPIFAGFTVKFYLFTVVASSGFLWLAGVAIISSLISLYYYLQIVRQMYIEKSDVESIEPGAIDTSGEAPTLSTSLVKPSKMTISVLLISLIAVVWLGVYPAPLLDVIEIASQALVMGS
tara:strand:+ start:244 stop:1767 length:1524 start_codon:yes stop_codon:yes gene_type:complete